MKKIKFAVVGCGNIGSRHFAILEAEQRADIVSVCDNEIDRCKGYSTLYGGVPYFLDYSGMIRHMDIDVINICPPHGLHAPMAIEAAEMGIHILVEKPMALTVNDAQKMITAAEENKGWMMVALTRYLQTIADYNADKL